MHQYNPLPGYLGSAARGCVIGVVGLMFVSLATGALGMLMAGSGCFVLPFLVLVGGGIGSLAGLTYQWYQTHLTRSRRPRRFRRRMRLMRRDDDNNSL
jgi:hypothetical protein